jgi:PRTRC genetic system protein A
VIRPPVDYLVARDGLPPRSGVGFDYVLGGDGLFAVVRSAHLELRVPVAPCRVRGLPPVHAACTLVQGRIPAALWGDLVRAARVRAMAGQEVPLVVAWEPATGYRVLRPPQVVGADRVLYRPTPGSVLELHSHHRMAAYFSRTDDADEQGLGLYAVVGRLDADRPEVVLRAGCYGHFLPLPWESVFDGERAPFRDAQFDPDEEASDVLPD